jgi:dihydrodipicolinate synthase/N-acetylneuraminate lyase
VEDLRRHPVPIGAVPIGAVPIGLVTLVHNSCLAAYAGWALESLCVGASGWVSGVADVAPAACVELYGLLSRGELEPARELYRPMLPLARFDMTRKLVQYFKAALDQIGLPGGPTRPPRLPLTEAEHDQLTAAMELVGLSAAAQ